MSKNYDQIATVSIDLATPLVDDTSFDNLCIVGPLPKTEPDNAPPKIGVYASLEEVVSAGWVVVGEEADPVGLAALAAFSQSPTPSSIYIAPLQTVETAELDTDGNNIYVSEPAVNAVQRACDVTGWYVLCTAGVDASEYEEIAAYIETQDRMFCYTELDCFEDEVVEFKPAVGDVYYRTMSIYGRQYAGQPTEEIPDANKYINCAWVAKWLNYESGTETSAFKSLSAIYPSQLTSTEMAAMKAGNVNYFITVGNKKVSMNGKVRAGEWVDIIRFRDWLKNDMQVRVVNLFVTTPKIPYTDNGISLVQNQMIASLKNGQDIGGIAPDEFDVDGNRIPGYSTSVPLAASIPASDKASRVLTGCKFKARLAGAIHFAELNGSLTYEM